jgi:hypothetical protein
VAIATQETAFPAHASGRSEPSGPGSVRSVTASGSLAGALRRSAEIERRIDSAVPWARLRGFRPVTG